MKKLLLSALMLCSALCGMAADKVTAKLSGSNLSIALENATSYCAFQMDITLPEGATAEAVEAVTARLTQEGSDSEIGGTKFIVASNVLTGNVLRVIAYNLANNQIEGATGDILKVTLGGTAVANPSDIKVSNILFVDKTKLTDVALANAVGESGSVKGDVNKDGVVNANDLTACVDILLGISGDYDMNAADVTGDGNVNANDLTAIVELLLK